jgi:hypothetical protein
MSHAENQVQIAIDESIRENCIVHLKAVADSQEWVDLANVLGARSSGRAHDCFDDGREVREYWGEDDDGDEWRVHLDGR